MKSTLLIFLTFLASCSYLSSEGDRPVARVNGDYLYASDLAGLVVPGSSATDSLNLTRSYIESWIRRKILIHQAALNLPEDQLDFSAQLEDYRNSLIIYAYENSLVAQRLDTIVTDAEIGEYYEQNQENFQLKHNIVKLSYVKIPQGSTQVRHIRRLFFSDNPADREKLADLCDKYSSQYFLDDETWMVFDDVLKEIPVQTYNQEEFLRYRRSFEMEDSLYFYFARFVDFKIKESNSPLQFERERIRSIILNKRKLTLINEMHQDIYDQALRNDKIEIY